MQILVIIPESHININFNSSIDTNTSPIAVIEDLLNILANEHHIQLQKIVDESIFQDFLKKRNITEDQFIEMMTMIDDNGIINTNTQPIDNQPIIEQYENIALCQQFNSSKNYY